MKNGAIITGTDRLKTESENGDYRTVLHES